MARVLKREAARRDLIAQWLWYAGNASIEVADRFFAAVDDTLNLISTQPEIGRACSFRTQDLQRIRRFPVSGGFDDILLFYLPLSDGVELVRLVHGGRDLESLLSDG